MKERKLIKQLEEEGYTDVHVCSIPPAVDGPEHTHDHHTVHVILEGGLIIIDNQGARTFHPGDRIEFPPGTRHKVRGVDNKGSMIIGVKSPVK